MTEEQLKIIQSFEVRVHQVLSLCDKLKEENADFLLRLKVQESVNNSLREENEQIQLKYDNLKMARMISVSKDDFRGAKDRLSRLVREVDECIALLNK